MAQETRSIELTTGVMLEYVERGDASGVPVLLLHGDFDSWHSFEQVLPELPPSIRAFALSLRGHGDSSRPVEGYAPADFAADIIAFMDAVDVEAAVIAGHSGHSLTAERLASDHPDRVLGLVLISPFATMHDKPAVQELRQAAASLSDPVDPEFVREFQQSTVVQPVPQAFMDTIVRESLKVPARVWKSRTAAVADTDGSAALEKITAPTLIIWGDEDAVSPRSEPTSLSAAIADARVAVYSGAGHGLHWEEPARFASDLVTFVDDIVG